MTDAPYYSDESVTLYLGDCREILPDLRLAVDAVVTDPPYGETSLRWDTWPQGWPTLIADVAKSMWMFGSARMFDTYRDEILSDWHMSQDVIWSKGRGVGTVNDRFFRTHEHVRHYYRGQWADVYRESPRVKVYGTPVGEETRRPAEAKSWHGWRNATTYTDDGTRLVHSVIPEEAMTAPWTNSADAMVFFGKIAEWLATEPDGKVAYGEFYVSRVTLSFDGEVIGHFESDDPTWQFIAGQEGNDHGN